MDVKEKARVRAKHYYELHKEVIRAKNLARYYERLNRQPRIKKPNLEERLGEAYLMEEALQQEQEDVSCVATLADTHYSGLCS